MSNMVVRTNIFSLNAHRNMKNVGLEQKRASNRLSSGYRINSAADDAAGLAISETMRAQIRGLDQASRNAQDGQAMLLTTEGGLEEIGNMLQRVRELLVQASNDTNTQDQRNMIEQEINQLSQEIGSMQQRVEFNTNRVLAMGPAMSSEINNAIANIESDGIRVSDAFSMLDANRRAVAEAREMLATLDGTMTLDQMNDRQRATIERALAAVNLSEVTGGVVTDAASTNIPSNIQGVNPVDLTPATGESKLLTSARAAWNALDALNDEFIAATADVAAATNAEEAAAANARLAAANEAIVAAGFVDEVALVAARDALGGTDGDGGLIGALVTAEGVAGTPSIATDSDGNVTGVTVGVATGLEGAKARVAALQEQIDVAMGHVSAGRGGDEHNVGTNDDDITWGERLGELMTLYAAEQTNLANMQTAYDTAVTNLNETAVHGLDALAENGLVVVGSTVTQIQGALNDRDTALADRIATLNNVRAEMLSAAEGQFTEVHAFANANTSGDFVAWYQVGANQNQGIQFDFESVSRTVSSAAAVVNMVSILVANPAGGSGIGRGIEVSPLIEQLQSSLDDVGRIRANLGAVQNRMDYTMRSLDISSENLQDSESRVRNADIAREMMRFTMSNVLQQASVSMLSQANQMPNNLLQLLR